MDLHLFSQYLDHTAGVDIQEPTTAAPLLPSPNDDVRALLAALQQSHADVETEKGSLARILHDDMGSLLVGAIMDMGWLAKQPGLAETVEDTLARAQGLLRTAIDLTRELVENVSPTLLENVGLYPTLRWHLKTSCRAASIPYTEDFPISEGPMLSATRIGIFRIFQEALKEVLSQRTPTELSVKVEVIGDVLHCHLRHRWHSGHDRDARSSSPETSMHLRARVVGGTLTWNRSRAGRHMHLQVPLEPSVAHPA